MKRIITLLLSCILLFSTASASSLFPSLEPQPEETTEKAPSYGVWADVQPTYVNPNYEVNTDVQVYTGIAFMYAVSQENYFAYGNYLGEQGYELSDSYQYSNSAYSLLQALHLTKADITYYILYAPEAERLMEIYPYGVEYERIDPLKGYTEVKKGESFTVANRAKVCIQSYSYTMLDEVRPILTANVQNLTSSWSDPEKNNLYTITLHLFLGETHYQIQMRDVGKQIKSMSINNQYYLHLGGLTSLEQADMIYSFNTTKSNIENLNPDCIAITFEYGTSKYVYYIK